MRFDQLCDARPREVFTPEFLVGKYLKSGAVLRRVIEEYVGSCGWRYSLRFWGDASLEDNV
jgi:hypothetical protein